MNISIQPAQEIHQHAIKGLLLANDLPVSDLDSSPVSFFVVWYGDELGGCIGLEKYKTVAFLRSLVVPEKMRGKGIAKNLVSYVENECRQQKIKQIYLLTETAESFFKKAGYKKIDRSGVADAIKASAEFSELCAHTAVVMKKEI